MTDDLKPRFKITGLSKQYFSLQVFRDLHMEIFPTIITGLLGPSGCGKSTLARILMRMENYNKGSILYNTQTWEGSLETFPITKFREQNQMVLQDPYLAVNPCFTMEKIISEPLAIARHSKIERKERTLEMLDLMEIDHKSLDKFPSEVSGGELQRAVLARALIQKPGFLVLDETFSSLDALMSKHLMKHLKKLSDRLGMGILFITHNSEQLRFFANGVAFSL